MAYKVRLTTPAEADAYAAFERIREAAPTHAERMAEGTLQGGVFARRDACSLFTHSRSRRDRAGHPVDSKADYDLTLDSLEDARQGIELLSVRQRDKVVSATVYVPEGKIGNFIRRVEQYLTEETQKGLPKNRRLIESISEIRTAILEAFWTDTPSLLPSQREAMWWEVRLRAADDPTGGRLITMGIALRWLGWRSMGI